MNIIDQQALDQLFNDARTANAWLEGDVTDEQLRQLYDLLKMAPTSGNCQPARFVFLRSPEAKERLRPALSPGNLDKTMKAPVVAIIAHDNQFQENLPRTFPHNPDFRKLFDGEENRVARAIDRQESDPQSLLHFTRRMLTVRKTHPALRVGTVDGCSHNGDFMSITRSEGAERLTWLFNFGEGTIAIAEHTAGKRIVDAFNGADAAALPPFAGVLLETP